jgi:tRNA modification GTPase
VGVIRLSGPKAYAIAQGLTKTYLKRVWQVFVSFMMLMAVMDEGLVLCFPNPHSFTGEDVVELQGHGGPVIQNALLGTFI